MRKRQKVLLISVLLFFTVSVFAQGNNDKISSNSSKNFQYVDLTMAAERSVQAVVHIKTEFIQKNSAFDSYFSGSFWEHFFGLDRPSEYPVVAAGSGVIISGDGYIITNNHVVEDAEKITVTLNDKREYQATIVGTDAEADLALVKIEGDNFPYLIFGNSDEVRIGEWVLAVGNPFNLTSTVTAGIVSAKARNLSILDDNANIESFIQTDAAVNQGNSGGALVNARGELIGINSAIASGNGYFTGYSFAIPSNVARKVAHDLQKYGMVQRAYIGVAIMDITPQKAAEMNLPNMNGVLVAQINEDGAAQKNGLSEEDIILSVNDIKVNSSSELREILMQSSPGETVKLTILRLGKEEVKSIQLLNRNGNTDVISPSSINAENILGGTYSDLGKRDLNYYRITGGVKVTDVGEGLLKQAGVKKGFVITIINNRIISNKEDLNRFLLNNKDKFISIEGVYDNGYYKYTYTIQLS